MTPLRAPYDLPDSVGRNNIIVARGKVESKGRAPLARHTCARYAADMRILANFDLWRWNR
jgi:hypothetical protein